MKSKFVSVILLASMLVVLVGCTAAPTPAPINTVAPPPPTQVVAPVSSPTLAVSPLETDAKAEGGQLMIYTSMNEKELTPILAAFKETYPFVDVKYFRTSDDQNVIGQARTDIQAGTYVADVFELDAINLTSQVKQELLTPFVPPESAAYPSTLKEPDGYWTSNRINTTVITYNTTLVAPADVPKTWNDLLDPKWNGKMAVESSDVELLGDMAAAWGTEKAYAFWEGIAAQNPVLEAGGYTVVAQGIADGIYSISPTTYAYRVEKLRAAGATIDWVKTDPIFAVTTTLSLAANAPHPATAKLYINWILSEAGQTAIRNLGRIPARPGFSADPPVLTAGLNLYYTAPITTERFDEFSAKWKSIFGLK